MGTDRQRVLLVGLGARGPAHPADLAWHPAIRDHYRPFGRFKVRDDLEALRAAGEVDSYDAEVEGEAATVAYDVVGVDRPEWDLRLQRAVGVHRERLRRKERR